MRFSSIIVTGLIAAGLLSVPAMVMMPNAFAGNPPERSGPGVAVHTGRMTLQQIAQIPQPRVPHRTIYSSKPELR